MRYGKMSRLMISWMTLLSYTRFYKIDVAKLKYFYEPQQYCESGKNSHLQITYQILDYKIINK